MHCIAPLLRTFLIYPTSCMPGIVLHCPVYSSIILHCPMLSNSVLHCPEYSSIILHCPMLSCIVLNCQCCPALHCAVLSCIVLSCLACCTVQCYSSVSYTVKGRPAVSIFILQCPTQSNVVSYCRALPLLSCSSCIVQSCPASCTVQCCLSEFCTVKISFCSVHFYSAVSYTVQCCPTVAVNTR